MTDVCCYQMLQVRGGRGEQGRAVLGGTSEHGRTVLREVQVRGRDPVSRRRKALGGT